MIRACLLLSVFGAELFAQSSGLTARQLYLQDDSKPAPAHTASRAAKAPKPAVPKPAPSPVSTDQPALASQPPAASEPASASEPAPASEPAVIRRAANSGGDPRFVTVALHLGLRYNVLQYLDRTGKNVREVDPDTTFHTGDCIAIRFRPNRTGYIYVFNQGSSGAWQAMLPSPLMPGEGNMVASGVDTKVPQDYCFKIGGPPGTDTLLVVLTEKQEDMYKLNDAIRNSKGGTPDAPPAPASDRIGRAVMAMQTGGGATPGSTHDNTPEVESALISRDLSVEKVGQPDTAGEPPNSVYVVKTAATTNERMVLEIKLRHE